MNKSLLNILGILRNNLTYTMVTRSQVRAFSVESVKTFHDSRKQQFTAELKGSAAKLDYHIKDNIITLIHTEVPEIFRGKGIGKVLAKEAFQYAQDSNLKVKIECDYILKHYRQNQSEYKAITVE